MPVVGEKVSTGDPKFITGLTTLNNLLDGSNKIPGTSLAAAAAIADTQLASPNNSAYRLVAAGASWFIGGGGGPGANTYIIVGGGEIPTLPPKSGSEVAATIQPIPVFHFAKADYEVAGKTQKLRLRAQVSANATAPAVTFTPGLYPVTVAGGVGAITFTLGTVVTGSTVAIASPSASTVTQANSGDFTIPSDGAYVLGFACSGSPAANARGLLTAQLQTRNV